MPRYKQCIECGEMKDMWKDFFRTTFGPPQDICRECEKKILEEDAKEDEDWQ